MGWTEGAAMVVTAPRELPALAAISRNAMVVSAGQLLEKAFNFLLVITIARYLSAEIFGQYGFLSAYVVLFSILSNLGLAVLCTRDVAREPGRAPAILTAALGAMALPSAVALLLIVGSVATTAGRAVDVSFAAAIAGADMIVGNMAAVLDAVPRAREKMLYSALPALLRSVVVLSLALLVLPLRPSLAQLFGILLAGSLLRLLLLLFFSKLIFGVLPGLPFDPALARRMVREAFPMALTSACIAIYYKIDAVMLFHMRGDRDVGLYLAATNLALAPFFLGASLHQATYPALARLYGKARDETLRVYRFSMKYALVIGLPLAGGSMALAPRLIQLVYGERYGDAATAMRILSAVLLVMFVNGLTGFAMLAANGQRQFMKLAAAGAAVNLGLNFVAIPLYGTAGAAVTTLIAELCVGGGCWIFLQRSHGISAPSGELVPVMASGAGMTLLALWCADWPLAAVIAVCATAYVALLATLRAVTRADISTLRSILWREPR